MHNEIKNGFTLAELMAVVIIVALLAALSTGYYKRSVEQARFSEGLMAASAIAEGLNRECLERQMNGQNCTGSGWIPHINQLDVGVSGSSCDQDACLTKHFTITIDPQGVTNAVRTDGIYASNDASNTYSIQIQPHFATSNRDQIACVGTGEGETFCQAMGYTQCANSVCTKPN